MFDKNDNEEDYDNDFSSLILPHCNLSYLHKLSVGATYSAQFDDPFLHMFLQQLFRRAPNLVSIFMYNDYDGGDLLENIVDFLHSFPEPLTQVKKCEKFSATFTSGTKLL